MEQFLKGLRAYGVIGQAVAATIALLASNWVIAMTVIASFYVGFSDWGVGFVNRPEVKATAIVFLVLLWAYVGITILVDRKRPRVVQAAQDLKYGLTLEGLVPIYDPKNPVAMLQFGVILKNYTAGPIRYEVDHFDVRIGSRALPKYQPGTLSAVMPRGAGRMSKGPAFSKDDLKEFFGKEVKGTVDTIIRYGHAERAPERKLTISFGLALVINEEAPLGWADSIHSEKDEAI